MSTGRVAVVTGGLGAVGSVVAATFVDAGYRVAVVDRGKAPAVAPTNREQRVLVIGSTDLGDLHGARTAMATVIGCYEQIDVLVNVAGGFRYELIEAASVEVWDLMYTLNLKTAVCATTAAIPYMLQSQSSAVINVGAAAANTTAAAGMGAYTASKAGIQKFTEGTAAELKGRGIRVNAILPGTVDTPQNRRDMPDADPSRWVTPEDLAKVILFLASDASAAINGASIPVPGRWA